MFNSGILDVAIGLVFIFLLLSLICSAISEMIEALLKKRAADLERGIREFLNDRDGTGLASKLYNHPLVFGLFDGDYEPKKTSKLPSYIPSRNFALALMDIIQPADKTKVSGAVDAVVSTPLTPPSSPGSGTPPQTRSTDPTKDSEAPSSGVSTASATPLPSGTGTSNAPTQSLRDAISNLQNAKVEQALYTLVDAAGNDLHKVRENIEKWYDSINERITGWYKRRSQWIILVLGLAVAIAVNADTLTIARSLSNDTAMRNSLVAAAQEYTKAVNASPTADKEKKAEEKLKENQEALQKLGLPIGWKADDKRLIPEREDTTGWFLKIIGWLLTAMAISLGAPFWFDLLNKFMTARSTLKPSKTEEPQKA
jgi:hypothetical protein